VASGFHDAQSEFDGGRVRCSSDIKVNTLTVSEAAMLVLLMGGIYKVRRCDSLRWQDIHIKFHEDRFRRLKVVRGHTHTHTHREQGDP
jgi:hypothetical protein